MLRSHVLSPALRDEYVGTSPDDEGPSGRAVRPGADWRTVLCHTDGLKCGELRIGVLAFDVEQAAMPMNFESQLCASEQRHVEGIDFENLMNEVEHDLLVRGDAEGFIEQSRVLGDVPLIGGDEEV